MTIKNTLSILFLTVFSLISTLPAALATNALPLTGEVANVQAVSTVKSSAAKNMTVTSVVVPGKFSYAVSRPSNSVPSSGVGQYAQALKKKAIGLLAHNFAAGASFFTLTAGDEVIITFSNGTSKTYVVYNVMSYEATKAGDFSKPFINARGKIVSAKQVFNKAYKSGTVTFQTCIARNGHASWGVIFVQARLKNN